MKQYDETLLKPYRDRIDGLDQKIVELLCERFKVIHEVAVLKTEHSIPATIHERIREVIDNATEMAAEQGDDDDLIRKVYTELVTLSCNLEEDIITANNAASNKPHAKTCNG